MCCWYVLSGLRPQPRGTLGVSTMRDYHRQNMRTESVPGAGKTYGTRAGRLSSRFTGACPTTVPTRRASPQRSSERLKCSMGGRGGKDRGSMLSCLFRVDRRWFYSELRPTLAGRRWPPSSTSKSSCELFEACRCQPDSHERGYALPRLGSAVWLSFSGVIVACR